MLFCLGIVKVKRDLISIASLFHELAVSAKKESTKRDHKHSRETSTTESKLKNDRKGKVLDMMRIGNSCEMVIMSMWNEPSPLTYP